MHLELNNTQFFFKTVISVFDHQSLIINRDDNCRKKNCNFSAIHRIFYLYKYAYLWNIYVIKKS